MSIRQLLAAAITMATAAPASIKGSRTREIKRTTSGKNRDKIKAARKQRRTGKS